MRDRTATKSRSEAKLSRLIVSVIAAAGGVFVAAEPLMFQAPPGLQVFQGIMVLGIWAVVVFGGTSAPSDS